MLMQNGGYLPPSLYYPEHLYLSHHATPPPSHIDVDYFGRADQHLAHHHHHHHRAAQPHPQAYYPSSNGYTPPHPQVPAAASCACACPPVPLQETFLHKILTGQGYENAAVRTDHHHHQHHHHHHHQPLGLMGSLKVNPYHPSDYAMAASCCYAGLAALPMSAAYPGSIPSIQ